MRCEGKIWREYHHVQCSHEAKVNRDGKDYCGTHDPVAVQARVDQRDARWAKQREGDSARYAAQAVARKRADLCVEACFGIPDEVLLKFTQISRERRQEIRGKFL